MSQNRNLVILGGSWTGRWQMARNEAAGSSFLHTALWYLLISVVLELVCQQIFCFSKSSFIHTIYWKYFFPMGFPSDFIENILLFHTQVCLILGWICSLTCTHTHNKGLMKQALLPDFFSLCFKHNDFKLMTSQIFCEAD